MAAGFFLAGPALVQAAIGQKVSAEELGGAAMHSAISGTVDFREPNDEACLARIRSIVEKWGYGGNLRGTVKNRKIRRRPRKKFMASTIHLRTPVRHEGNYCAHCGW